MEELGILNNKKINYQRHSLEIDWAKDMPNDNWLLFVIIEHKHKSILREIANKAIDRDVCYVCCVGEQGELLHDFIDAEVVFREVDPDPHHLPPFDVIMTTWHKDIDEAVWFASFAAENPPEIIQTIFCLDASENSVKEELKDLIGQFSSGNY